MESSSHRKPYNPPVNKLWWLKNRVYTKYMIRELTAVFCLWVAIELLLFSASPLFSTEPDLWVSDFVQKPWVIALNIISLVAVLFHAVTWFNIMPKAVRLFRSRAPEETRLVPPIVWILLLWGITLIASAIIIFVLY